MREVWERGGGRKGLNGWCGVGVGLVKRLEIGVGDFWLDSKYFVGER